MNIKNVSIIAHVDHGKTTLVDGLLKQSKTFRDNEAEMTQTLIMDSNDQERERGITILAKNISVIYKDTKINIIDTPGHADFGGEVERTLNMVEGVLLLVDAQEGPMPQTKFVLRKALELDLKVIVIINKIDKKDSRVRNTLNKIHDLFLELATIDSHLDFPVLYAVGREEKAWNDVPADFNSPADLTPVFDAILKYIPSPELSVEGPFQMLVSSLDWDFYKGVYALGKVNRGIVKAGMSVVLIKSDSSIENNIVSKVFLSQGLKRVEVDEGLAGDIVTLTGIKNVGIGDTIADVSNPEALPVIKTEEPVLSMAIGPNTSPFFGTEGKYFSGRQILDRIERELQTNIAMKFKITESGQYILYGRGELHLSIFLETLRREGYEIEVGKPSIVYKEINGVSMEPVEELTVDVENEYLGAVKSEVGRRKGVLLVQEDISSGSTRLVYDITSAGLLGLRSMLLTLSKGTSVLSSIFLRYEKVASALPSMRKGAIIASEKGKSLTYGLRIAQDKGNLFIGPQVQVYAGMIVGINGRSEDVEINVCKEKQLTNNRSVGEDAIILPPPVTLSLEQYLGLLENDELLEITPKSLRLRKRILDSTKRYRQNKKQ